MAIDVRPIGFAVTPSIERSARTVVTAGSQEQGESTVVGHLVAGEGDVPGEISLDRDALGSAGFKGGAGETLAVPSADAQTRIVVGIGEGRGLDTTRLRDAGAAFALAAGSHSQLALRVPSVPDLTPFDVAQALTEGVLLARYHYDVLKQASTGDDTDATSLHLVADANDVEAVERGAARGKVFAAATSLARDLANTPHNYLTASKLADLAAALAPDCGLEAQVFGKDELEAMGCGGLLGVNAGSVEPPRMIKLIYRPSNGASSASPHLTLVGKGIMYDSGGLALKPGDEVHAQMKNDMSGAGAVFAAMWALHALDCPTAVTAYLMCTDNMPSGTAMALGDVITIRGGTTVEVINTDAEGRLVMADALVLATEEPTDAIVDIATLTGACMRALGTQVAGVMGNDQSLVDQVSASAARTDEPVWQLPLERRYRKELDSGVADLRNLGGANAGAITAALFLSEFVADRPWAHIDIAGTANNATRSLWRTAGCTGFGARLLLDFALDFRPPGN